MSISVFACDLNPLDILNYLIKYADDVTFLSPQRSKTTVELEMAHVRNWAIENKMTVNLLKTVEIAFHRPNVSHDLFPHAMPNVSRVLVAKLLGVYYLRHDLNFSQHVESVVAWWLSGRALDLRFTGLIPSRPAFTQHRLTQPCISPGSLNRVPASAGSKDGILTTAGWQVTLCDPIWYVSLTFP